VEIDFGSEGERGHNWNRGISGKLRRYCGDGVEGGGNTVEGVETPRKSAVLGRLQTVVGLP
jgi:hypothetical protein